jgi:soluble lytic murein transglycosylase-like protein
MNSPIVNFVKWALGVLVLSTLPGSAGAEIFAYVDQNGKLVVSDKKADGRYMQFDPLNYKPEKKAHDRSEDKLVAMHEKALRYNDVINEIAKEVGLNAHLIHAVIQVESAYNPLAISSKGAQGLMQLIPATAARFGVDRVHDPESNIRGGARYLKKLLELFNNDLRLTLAAYNAGEGAVQKYNNKVPPYPETQAYVTRVISIFEQRNNRENHKSYGRFM